ncbi:NAD(P)H-quinone oxidoreductase [Denitrificimonas sp. JX-1]|uniref:NAD(P)H-quinone oxidoreductase n=1 Tax=Denitrificimonas halotolerans TaxID=3098930 RepID=A0ABU5GP79_9GAMM|nr:NAD(P)H-quinone oxidoreductase [Denitrificimonas sp. JX-1]MDY7218669.1 NAD(P)H-quinone oxidoreductase [Denitrificimonas sp. JX-1]
MKALQGSEGRPTLIECETPNCEAGQVRIRVVAAGLNRADLLQAAGLYPPPPGVTDVLGLECAGVISEVSERSAWKVGDRVCALLAGGGMAEEVCVDERHILPVPEGLSLLEAAAIPEVYATAWLNIFQLGQVQPGEKVLIHAGASGVGSAAIQLCKAFASPCWVSVGSAERLAYCVDLGAEGGVVRGDNIEGLHDFAPFDVILDPVGANYAAQNLKMLAMEGRWVNIGLMGGRRAELDLAQLLGKRIKLIGSTLRSRSDDFKGQLMAQLAEKAWPLFTQGKLLAQVDEVFAWDDADAAFARLASNQVNGKVVLHISEE